MLRGDLGRKQNTSSSPRPVTRPRMVHVIAAGLLLAVIFVGCEPGPEIDARLDELEKQKKVACYSQEWSCSDTHEKIGKKRETLLTCPELLARIPIGKACVEARKLVQSECFAGSPDKGHEDIIEGLTRGLNECIRKASIRGPGGGPC
jgi:hypothetical protein